MSQATLVMFVFLEDSGAGYDNCFLMYDERVYGSSTLLNGCYCDELQGHASIYLRTFDLLVTFVFLLLLLFSFPILFFTGSLKLLKRAIYLFV